MSFRQMIAPAMLSNTETVTFWKQLGAKDRPQVILLKPKEVHMGEKSLEIP